MRRIALAALLACAVWACAENPERFEIARTGNDVAIAPFEQHEECIPLESGERIEFRYRSSAPVDFDIHYHEANALIVPVARPRSSDEAGAFTPSRAAIHCLVWEAGVQGSVLDFRIRPLPVLPQ